MVYMMDSLLQYLPYALVVGFVFILMGIFVLATVNFFRNVERRMASDPKLKRKRSATV